MTVIIWGNMKSIKCALYFYIMLTIGLVAATGCGYQFAGVQKTPFDIRRISVLMFENHTSEIGVEDVFSKDLISEVTRDGRMQLSDTDAADAVFSGVVTAMDIDTISRENGYAAAERRVSITVDVKLKDRNGDVLWSAKGIQANESYLVAEDKLATEYNRKLAIAEVARKISQNIYLQLNQVF